MSTDVVVIGVGNPYRRDDRVGLDILQGVAALQLPGVRCLESDGESTALCDAWNGVRLAVVVDAVRTGAPPGTLHLGTMGADAMAVHTPPGGTHALSLGEALALGEVLERLPERLLVAGVEVGDVDPGVGLSAPVAAAVAHAVDAVRAACVAMEV